MSLSLWLEKTIRRMFESDTMTVNVLELPPGLGKTKTAIDVAVELASKGTTVFFFTPTHAAALTALAYAINATYERVYTSNLRVPYIVYYEGVSRQCPFFQYPKLLEYAAKHARSKLWLTREEYQRVRKVLGRNPNPSAIVRAFGWSFVCRKLCPLYRSKRTYEPYRIFIPRSFDQLTNKVLTGEARGYIVKASKYLGEMSKKKLVFRIAPYINFKNGMFYGVCSRMLIYKPVARDRQGRRRVFTWLSGALIIAPTSCFGHLSKLIYKIREISKKVPSVPVPVVVMDEYDFFFYKPAYSVLATMRWVGKERNVAEAYLRHLVNAASATGGVDEDVVLATATAVAFLRQVIKICDDFIENGNVDQVVTSAVSMIGDIIAAPPYSYTGEPNPPFRTHVVKIASPEELTRNMLPLIEAVLKEFGAHFARVEKIAKLGIGYYLKLWSSVLPSIPQDVVESAGEEDLTRYMAGLKRTLKSGEEVLEVVYIPVETPASVARYIYNIRLFAGPANEKGTRKFGVIYSARQARVRAIRYDPVKDKFVSAHADFILYMITYDAKWWWLNVPARIVLMSATGMAWDSDFYLTKIGLTNPFDENNFVITYLRGYKFLQRRQYSDRIEYVFEPQKGPSPYKKKIVIVTCSYDIIDAYAHHAEFDVDRLKFIPPKGSDVYSIAESLAPYVYGTGNFVRSTDEILPKLGRYHGGVLAIVQRKDVALMFTNAVANYLRKTYRDLRVQWCSETDCYDMHEPFMPAEAAYFLLRMRSKNAPDKEVRVFVTWFRSRMSRGVDLPADTAVPYVICVGSPFRPPGSIDIYEDRPLYTWEIYAKSLKLEIVRKVWSPRVYLEPNPIPVSIGYMPYEVAEAVNELQQIVGRACRQAVRIGKYVVKIVVHYRLFNKILLYSQMWFKEIIFMRGKKACEEAVARGKMKEMMRQQQAQQQQLHQHPQSQQTGPPQDQQGKPQ